MCASSPAEFQETVSNIHEKMFILMYYLLADEFRTVPENLY